MDFLKIIVKKDMKIINIYTDLQMPSKIGKHIYIMIVIKWNIAISKLVHLLSN